MTAIIIRNSDGRVQEVADTISAGADHFTLTTNGVQHLVSNNAYGYAVSIVNGVTGVPSDLVGGWNYNYVSSAFVGSGVSPPTPPAALTGWVTKAAIPSNEFIPLVVEAWSGPAGYNRIKNDANGGWIFDTIATSQTVDPNGIDSMGVNTFMNVVNYMLNTNAASDGQPLMSVTQENLLIAAWPNL